MLTCHRNPFHSDCSPALQSMCPPRCPPCVNLHSLCPPSLSDEGDYVCPVPPRPPRIRQPATTRKATTTLIMHPTQSSTKLLPPQQSQGLGRGHANVQFRRYDLTNGSAPTTSDHDVSHSPKQQRHGPWCGLVDGDAMSLVSLTT